MDCHCVFDRWAILLKGLGHPIRGLEEAYQKVCHCLFDRRAILLKGMGHPIKRFGEPIQRVAIA